MSPWARGRALVASTVREVRSAPSTVDAKGAKGAEAVWKRSRVTLLVGVVALATAVPLCAYAGHVLRSLERRSVDQRFTIRGSRSAPKDVVVVAIDDKTFEDFDRFSRTHPGFVTSWPFPRCDHAQVLDRIAAGRPKGIAVDLQFTEPTTSVCDEALFGAVARARRVVLGTTLVDGNGRTNVFGGNLPPGSAAASTLLPADYGGVLRRIPYTVNGLTTFGVAAAAV